MMSAPAWADGQRRLSVVIFPTINSTELEVWESKYYPYNVMSPIKVAGKAFKALLLFMFVPAIMLTLVWALNTIMNALYQATMKERHVVGTAQTGRALIRLRVFDRARVQEIGVRNVKGTDKRFTLDSDEDIYWFDSAISGLGIPFEYGLDLFGLTGQSYKGQKMSRPTWDQFKGSSHWQSIKKAIYEAYRQSMSQVRNAIRNNEPNAKLTGNDNFSSSYLTVGRILAPTATSTRKRRDYIISLGSFANGSLDSVRVGEVLEVVRADTYVTVVPEDPVVVLPKVIGRVKVIKVYEDNAVVRVIKDNRKEPITLKDIVVKKTAITGR